MSKERLEEINKRAKHRVLENSRGEVRYRFTEINTEDFDWLIEQAERKIELENEIKSHTKHGRNYTNEQYVELLNKNKRYREIIEKVIYETYEEYDALRRETLI